jgi:hypothetical protein
LEFSLQYTGEYGDKISLGLCGKFDLDFMHAAAIAWPELTNAILRAQAAVRRSRCADAFPGGGPYPDQANQQEEE